MTTPCPRPSTAVARWPRMAALAAALFVFAARPAHAQWTVTPYIWATSIDADVSVVGRSALDEHIPFSDLVEDIDAALLLRVEAQHGAYGGMVDLFWTKMTNAGNQVPLPGGGAGTLDAHIDMTVLDATGSYAPGGNGQGFSFVLGARLLGQKTELDLSVPTGPTTTTTQESKANDLFVDAIVGGRYRARLARHWSVDARADVGTGGTDLTWSAGAEVGYGFGVSQRVTVTAGYKYLAIDYKQNGPVQVDMAMSGFLTGVRIAL